ncbi:hypothetical protein [Bacillus sp. EB600]|nr:hypothetical protein [Bacillus sp. EB600]MCQ6281248.1 hypothetical protein [Bacillus sp. EB600]
MTKDKELDELSQAFLESIDKDDPFGLNEEIKIIAFNFRIVVKKMGF